MTIADYINKIQTQSAQSSYEALRPLYLDYQAYLKQRISINPSDVKARCQLASIYLFLREAATKSIGIIEPVLNSANDQLTNQQRIAIYTNLAFYYGEELGDETKQAEYLSKAIALTPTVANPYSALALYYADRHQLDQALSLFKQAYQLDNNSNNTDNGADSSCYNSFYNYAVALYQNKQYQLAHEILTELLTKEPDNQQALYALAACDYYLENYPAVLTLLEQLKQLTLTDIYHENIADIYYLLGDYQNYLTLLAEVPCKLYPETSWLAPYFYALLNQGEINKLQDEYQQIIAGKKQDIVEAQEDPEEDMNDRMEFAAKLAQEQQQIITAYQQITEQQLKPTVSLNLSYHYGCYLLDCVQHGRY